MSAAGEQARALLERIPYARFLGVRIEMSGHEMTAVLPFTDQLIGDPALPALHGGGLGAFMEMTALAQLMLAQPGMPRQPRAIGLTVQYLRSGRGRDTYACAEIKRLGHRVGYVQVEAWQEVRAEPIAALHSHFLITPAPVGEP